MNSMFENHCTCMHYSSLCKYCLEKSKEFWEQCHKEDIENERLSRKEYNLKHQKSPTELLESFGLDMRNVNIPYEDEDEAWFGKIKMRR